MSKRESEEAVREDCTLQAWSGRTGVRYMHEMQKQRCLPALIDD